MLSTVTSAALPLWRADAGESLTGQNNGLTFEQFIRAALHDYGVPGAVVAVSSASETVFLKGFGIRRQGAADLVDENTRFQVASVSKFITATAVGALVDRGVVSWDAPVRSFAPTTELAEPYATANASLRDYFAHRTGLPAYAGDLLAQLGLSSDELVRRARFLPFTHSFRARWAYSNYGVFLGHQSCAQAARTTAPELLSREMFGLLGMQRTGPTFAELLRDDNHASAHNLDGSIMPFENVDSFAGAGAVVSTGADIGRWLRMLLAGGKIEEQRVLAKATIDEIFAASMVQGIGGPLRDPNDCAGLGCESYHFLRHRVIEKNGALNGVRTIVTLVPERQIGIAVLANKQLTVFPEAVRAEFLERVLGSSGVDLQAQVRAEQPAWRALAALPSPPDDAMALARDLDAFAGRYESDCYGSWAAAPNGAGLRLRIGEQGYPGRLTHWSGDAFLLSFDNPDVAPGLVTFAFDGVSPRAIGFRGSEIPNAFSLNYGRFKRVS